MIYHACRDITVIRVFLNIIPTVAALTKPVALIICAAVHQKQHVVFFGWIIPVGRVDPHGLFHRDRALPKNRFQRVRTAGVMDKLQLSLLRAGCGKGFKRRFVQHFSFSLQLFFESQPSSPWRWASFSWRSACRSNRGPAGHTQRGFP